MPMFLTMLLRCNLKFVDRDSSSNESLATRLLQLNVLWTICVYYTEVTEYSELSMLSHF